MSLKGFIRPERKNALPLRVSLGNHVTLDERQRWTNHHNGRFCKIIRKVVTPHVVRLWWARTEVIEQYVHLIADNQLSFVFGYGGNVFSSSPLLLINVSTTLPACFPVVYPTNSSYFNTESTDPCKKRHGGLFNGLCPGHKGMVNEAFCTHVRVTAPSRQWACATSAEDLRSRCAVSTGFQDTVDHLK